MTGWIKLYRDMEHHWLHPTQEDRSFTRLEAWVDLILMVNHSDRKIRLGNDLYYVKRGQKITSIRKLSLRWKWSKEKVTSFLHLLEKDDMIIRQPDTKKTVLTVVNYAKYQDWTSYNRTPFGHLSDTNRTLTGTNNNEKNDKEWEEGAALSPNEIKLLEKQYPELKDEFPYMERTQINKLLYSIKENRKKEEQ